MGNKVKMVFKDQREKKDPMEVPVLMVNQDIMVIEVIKVHREKKVSKGRQDNQDLLDLTVNEVILDQKVESVISVCPVLLDQLENQLQSTCGLPKIKFLLFWTN